MLSLKLHIFLVISMLCFMLYIIYLIKNEIIELKYSLLWFTLAFTLLILSFCPGIVILISAFLGIGLPVNSLYLIAIFFILLIIISLTVVISKMHKSIIRLTQEISLIKMKVDKADMSDNKY